MSHGHRGPQHTLIAGALHNFGTSPSRGSFFPVPGQRVCFFLEPLQLWDARERARRRKFLADIKEQPWLVVCVLPARLRGTGGYSEQRLCVPFTHKKTPEPLPPTPQIQFRSIARSQIRVWFAQVYRVTFNWRAPQNLRGLHKDSGSRDINCIIFFIDKSYLVEPP